MLLSLLILFHLLSTSIRLIFYTDRNYKTNENYTHIHTFTKHIVQKKNTMRKILLFVCKYALLIEPRFRLNSFFMVGYFQDNATLGIEGLEELHNNIMFYSFLILFTVSLVMLCIIITYPIINKFYTKISDLVHPHNEPTLTTKPKKINKPRPRTTIDVKIIKNNNYYYIVDTKKKNGFNLTQVYTPDGPGIPTLCHVQTRTSYYKGYCLGTINQIDLDHITIQGKSCLGRYINITPDPNYIITSASLPISRNLPHRGFAIHRTPRTIWATSRIA